MAYIIPSTGKKSSMRKYLYTAALLFLTIAANAQSKTHRFGLAIGGGPQDYNGERGNGVTESDDIWRGAVVISAGYYINKSFDLGMFGSGGDLGYCPDASAAASPIDANDRCPGCLGRQGLGNLSGRVIAGGLSLCYKFANGYLLKESCPVKPYIYAGAAFNNITDPMDMRCIRVGNYGTLNAGLGVRYYITERFNIGYQMSFGYFTRDDIDFMAHDKVGDSYMQNALMVGFDLF